MATRKSLKSHPGGDARYITLDRTLARYKYRKDALLEVLNVAQATFGYLSEELLHYVSQQLKLPFARVYGVATFYHMYALEPTGDHHCFICTDPACMIAGGEELLAASQRYAQAATKDNITVKRATCLGLCDQAPAALDNGVAYVTLTADDIALMFLGQAPRAGLHVTGEPRIMTRHIGELEPTDLERHRQHGAFLALEKVLSDASPESVIATIKESGLAGRGGAGFPTGLKWEFTRNAAGEPKYVVCNFDESEPGTFKDRCLMQGDPFRVLEGMLICGYVIGAQQGYVFVRGEYHEAAGTVQEAIDTLYRANLLGQNILGTDFSFDIELRHGAGAYICGEETALFEAVEGKRGHPRSKPPFPTTHGLFGKPTVVNNVETLAIVPDLVLNGGSWLRQWGTETSAGTKLFCLSGHVNRPGVVEAPYGITLRSLIERYGGGFDGEPKAILMGGAAGGLLHPDQLDVPLSDAALRPFGAPIGSGVIMVFNQSVDLLQILKSLARFFVHETCGKCMPCRLGTYQVHALLEKISDGHGTTGDLEKLDHLSQWMRKINLCGLGQSAPNTVITSLKYFRPEYEQRVQTGQQADAGIE